MASAKPSSQWRVTTKRKHSSYHLDHLVLTTLAGCSGYLLLPMQALLPFVLVDTSSPTIHHLESKL